ncbi:hypothetical protein ScPMuIL_018381 [Solemya velum]
MAKTLFFKDIGSSLIDDVNSGEFNTKDLSVSWLFSDSRKAAIFKKLRGLEIPQVIYLFQELRSKNSDDHRNAFIIEEYMASCVEFLDMKKCLLFSEVMVLSGFRGYRFLSTFFEYLSFKIESVEFEPQYIPRLMFFVFFHGSAPLLLLSKLEDVVYANLDSFTLKDLSVICLGYFRGHRRIHSYKLLDRIADRTVKEIDQIDEQQLTNILKSFRHSGFLKASFYSQLADSLSSHQVPEKVTRLNTVMHLLMVFASLKIYHKPLLEYLADRTYKLLDQSQARGWTLRSKEIAKITWAVGTFCHQPDHWRKFSQKILSSFRGNVNLIDGSQYPESIADVVQGLIYMDVFPKDLMGHILQSKVADSLRDHPTAEKIFQLLLADATARIECPHYTGPFLSQEFHDSIHSRAGVFRELDFELRFRKGLSCILETLQDMLGSGCVHCHFILPHMKTSDIEIRLDKRGIPVQFEPLDYRQLMDKSSPSSEPVSRMRRTENLLKQLYSTDENRQPEKSDKGAPKRLVIEVIGRNQCAHESNMLLGNFQTKLRQLKKLGYEEWVIMPEQSRDMENMTRGERYTYLRQNLCDNYGLSSQIPSSVTCVDEQSGENYEH